MEKELTEVEKAQQVLIEDKKKRMEAFIKEYQELCKKYNCELYSEVKLRAL